MTTFADRLHAYLYPEQYPPGTPLHDPDHAYWSSGYAYRDVDGADDDLHPTGEPWEWPGADVCKAVAEMVERERRREATTLAAYASANDGTPGGPCSLLLLDPHGVTAEQHTIDGSTRLADVEHLAGRFLVAMAAEGVACSVVVTPAHADAPARSSEALPGLPGAATRATDPWAEQGPGTLDDWRAEVAANDTRLGYADWCEHQSEANDDSPAELPEPYAYVVERDNGNPYGVHAFWPTKKGREGLESDLADDSPYGTNPRVVPVYTHPARPESPPAGHQIRADLGDGPQHYGIPATVATAMLGAGTLRLLHTSPDGWHTYEVIGDLAHADLIEDAIDAASAGHVPTPPDRRRIPAGVHWTGEPGDPIEIVDTPDNDADAAALLGMVDEGNDDMAAALRVAALTDCEWVVYAPTGPDHWEVTAWATEEQARKDVDASLPGSFYFNGRTHRPIEAGPGLFGYTHAEEIQGAPAEPGEA